MVTGCLSPRRQSKTFQRPMVAPTSVRPGRAAETKERSIALCCRPKPDSASSIRHKIGCGTPEAMTENCNGPQVFTQRLKRRQQRHAAAQAWHSQAWKRGQGRQGQEPKAGHCHRFVGGAQEGEEGSKAKSSR